MTEQLTIEQVFSPLIRNEYWVVTFLKNYKDLLRNSSEKEMYDLFKMIFEDWYLFNHKPNLLASEQENERLCNDLNDHWNDVLNKRLEVSPHKEEINFYPPFDVGDTVDLKFRVYIDKNGKADHFGEPFQVAVGVASTMNHYYERFRHLSHWEDSRLWFAPILEINTNDLSTAQKEKLVSAIRYFNKYGKISYGERPASVDDCVYWNGVCGACDIGNAGDCPCEYYEARQPE